MAVGLSNDGWELLGDLWSIRGFIHKGLSPERWGRNPTYYQRVWQAARESALRWPGFRRLTLSASEQRVLVDGIQELRDLDPEDF